MSDLDLSTRLFLQLAIILAACRVVGWFAVRLGQSRVVSEMVTGVALGPSLLGALLPAQHRWLFPPESMSVLTAASQIGVVLYMFLVGAELNVDRIRAQMRSAASIAVAGIIAPLALGCLIGAFLIDDPRFFRAGVPPWTGMLFLGTAMSITAFPMLARIIHEKGLTGTSLGTLALAAGSLGDVAAWCLLAVVLAAFQGNPALALWTLGGGLAYVAAVFLVLGPAFRRLDGAMTEAEPRPSALSWILIALMFGAWITDAVGVYAIFGAFFLGAAVPLGRLARGLRVALEPLTASLLLPLFFVHSGMRTRLDLIASASLLFLTLLILAAACLGKGVATWAAARLHGEPPRVAVALGALLNARGLMELVILNIGLEHGVITPTLFSVMVVMAIVTTLMASPTFEIAMRGVPADRQGIP